MCLKKCNFCFEEKDELEFYTYNKTQCKTCLRAKTRKNVKNNPEKKKEQDKQYKINNREKVREYSRKWKRNNQDKIKLSRIRDKDLKKIQDRNYYERKKNQLLKKNSEYRKKNRKILNQKQNERRKTDPAFRMRQLLSKRIVKVLNGISKSAGTMELIGCSIPELFTHLEKQFQPGMTFDNYGKGGWQTDHKIPCSFFNLLDPEEQKKCFHYSNLQPMWEMDNWKKNDLLPDGTRARHLNK